MTIRKKILISVLAFLSIGCLVLYIVLFIDTEVYPSYNIEGLRLYSNDSIPPGKAVTSVDSLFKNIVTDGEWFKDRDRRVMNLRGINLGGSSKLPFSPKPASHTKEGFFESAKTVSFVGRPFPLSEADAHFARLKSWGFQFIRLVVTWEAIEHEGPGIYDQAYLNYLYQIVRKAQAYRINVFIDPHQDVWSRFTGGDGAPLWTLEKAGLDATRFSESGAAIIHQVYGDPLPKMIWPTNYSKLGAATMFTLFFGGRDFAPNAKVDTISLQDYLQDHYINAVRQVAMKLKDLPNVIGFDTLNEPSAGYIGQTNLDTLSLLRIGPMPTYFQGMVAGDGNSVETGVWTFASTGFKETKKIEINPGHVKAWKDGAPDIWQREGVWTYDNDKKPVLLKTKYFAQRHGVPVDFSADYWKPFALKFAKAIHAIDPRWIIFVEPALFTKLPKFSATESSNMVNAGHWYGGITLLTKKYNSWFNADVENVKPLFGKRSIREYFIRQPGDLKKKTKALLGDRPTLIGEFGIPFDMNERKAYRDNDFSDQEASIELFFIGMEANLLNYTLWNYTPDNDNVHGDQWNNEDLSIFSVSQQKDKGNINSGGRALASVIRPYPYKVSGTPIQFFFNKDKDEFYLKFRNDPSITSPTEIFIPEFHYGTGYDVFVTKGKIMKDVENNLLLYYPEGADDHVVVVRKKKT